jgi:succinoglycan biosynthesis transport protein ExoP
MANLPSLYRDTPVSIITPIIPLNFVYPGLSLAQIVAIVWAYRKLTVLIGFVVVSLTVATLTLWPRTYTAMVTMMVNYEVNDPLNGKELPVGQMNSYIATQIELMQTPELLLAVVDRLHMVDDLKYTKNYSGNSGTLREWVGTQLRKTLAIYRGQQGSQLIYITYAANDRAEAALIANTIADIYKEQDHLRSTGPPSERTKRYGEQLSELKSKVDQAQKDVTAFHQRNGLINQGDAANVDVVLLATLEERLLEAQNSRRAADARAVGDQSVSDQVLASTEVQSLKTQLANQQLRLTQLNFIYTPQHPDIVELQSQLETTQRSLTAALRSYSANAAAELSVAQRLETNLQRGVTEQRTKVLATGQLHDEATKYLLELQSAQTVYKRALDGYDQIMFASGGHYTNVGLVSRASPPVKASKPRVLAGLAMGCIAAAILGFGIPLLYEFERHHGVTVLMEFDKFSLRTAT